MQYAKFALLKEQMSEPGSAVNIDSGLHLCNAAAAELKQLIRSGILCAAPHATDR